MKTARNILIGILVFCGIGALFATRGLGEIKKMVINDVDLSKMADGAYTGNFKKARWNYTVEVTVKDHRLVSVKPVSGRPNPGITSVADRAERAMIEKQSLIIDVISGASVNTRAFQKAVENALTAGGVAPPRKE